MILGRLVTGTVIGAAIALGPGQSATAEVLDIGSTFTDSGTNSPNSFSQSVTLAPGVTLVDGGALSLTISIVPTGDAAGNEWLVFDYQTVTPGAVLSQSGDNWAIGQTGITVTVPTDFDGAFAEFLDFHRLGNNPIKWHLPRLFRRGQPGSWWTWDRGRSCRGLHRRCTSGTTRRPWGISQSVWPTWQ